MYSTQPLQRTDVPWRDPNNWMGSSELEKPRAIELDRMINEIIRVIKVYGVLYFGTEETLNNLVDVKILQSGENNIHEYLKDDIDLRLTYQSESTDREVSVEMGNSPGIHE
ncbi:DgyrCDS3940 [Dimorphilus gyrociliatus]|uniref:DgyrCDS3940 n=1 Tax=Dimorphilus gyrociliatus TaxID=2664684 RepID=A0A7I8VF52_9ANNE|nr:DgyrCDS3940 [Dimorphilus gyrociliatus]